MPPQVFRNYSTAHMKCEVFMFFAQHDCLNTITLLRGTKSSSEAMSCVKCTFPLISRGFGRCRPCHTCKDDHRLQQYVATQDTTRQDQMVTTVRGIYIILLGTTRCSVRESQRVHDDICSSIVYCTNLLLLFSSSFGIVEMAWDMMRLIVGSQKNLLIYPFEVL